MPSGGDSYWEYYRSLPESLRSVELPLKLVRCGYVKSDHTVFERSAYPFEVWEEVVAGAGFVTVNDVNFAVKAGDIYRLPMGADHRLAGDRHQLWGKKFFLLEGSMVPMLIEQFGFKEQYHFPGGAKESRGIFDILNDSWRSHSFDMHLTAAEQFMKFLWRLRFAGEVFRGNGISPKVQQLMVSIDRHFQLHLDLDHLAKVFNISRSHLQTLFKKELGITPYEYHLRRKFEKAKELLLQSSLSISAISQQLAFHDRFHFSREFSRRFGISPAAFRKKSSSR